MVYVLISEDDNMCLGVFTTRDQAIDKMITVAKIAKENLEKEVYDYIPEAFIIQYVEMDQPEFKMYSEVFEEWELSCEYDMLYLNYKTKGVDEEVVEHDIA